MKKLILFFFFSGSLDSFSQVSGSRLDSVTKLEPIECCGVATTGYIAYGGSLHEAPKPDTLRAIILVTTSPNGIAHSRMGYVVITDGRKPVYLTCDKKALKLPQVGWGWVEAGEGRR